MIYSDEFRNKRILISGGSSGIGKETALQLSSLGAKISILARNEEKMISAVSSLKGYGHNYFILDLEDVDSIESRVKEIISSVGPIDGFVHCAAIAEVRPLNMSKYPFMLRVMNINFFSFIELIRCITRKGFYNPAMSIVGVSSVSSLQGNSAKTAYSASKGAMNAAIRCLAKELSDKKIRINAVAPAIINTPMSENFLEQGLELKNYHDQLQRQYLGAGEPIDVANTIMFLLSGISRMITGATIGIDGGRLTS